MEDEYDEYFLWLCELVNADMDRYSELLFQLHDMDFFWVLELDSSRATEGLALREEWYGLNPYADWIMFLEKECSVLEALIGLARRMESMLSDLNTGDRTRVWFWEMIRNLGLKKYTNTKMAGEFGAILDIQMVIDNWLNRDFDDGGWGSVFPLDNPTCDQRERSMIYQLYDYLFEKHPE